MHPAPSIILFTTASGLGYGLLFIMGLAGAFNFLPHSNWFAALTLGLALGTVSVGLLSSTFHLGHPERAWRAVTQWRSSWLSREGVMAILVYGPAFYFGAGWIIFDQKVLAWQANSLVLATGAAVTVFCTAMIYASLKSIPRWNNRWVSAVYLSLSLMTGTIWFIALWVLFFPLPTVLVTVTLGSIVIAGVCKYSYWRYIDNASTVSTAETATGLGTNGKTRLLEPPHTGRNYLLEEMGYKVARKHASKLRSICLMLAFGLPIACYSLILVSPAPLEILLAFIAAILGQIGVTIERWLFFAEAEHVVMLYYGKEQVNG